MTRQQLLAKLHEDVHLTWKNAFWILAGVVSTMLALGSATAVHGSKIEDHQRILDERAPAVTELARVAQQLNSESAAMAEFRRNDEQWKRRIEEKLDRALEK